MLHLTHCSIEWTDTGARTVFTDTLETSAWPHPEVTSYHVIADRLGCGTDLLGFTREHELAHCLMEQWLHDRPSRTLLAVARGTPLPWSETTYEELAAQTLQGWVRSNKRPIIGGQDWDARKAQFLGYVARLDAEYAGQQHAA